MSMIRYAKTYPLKKILQYQGKLYVAVSEEDDILYLFHHIHHEKKKDDTLEHEVHHCGGEHSEVDPDVAYTIEHCSHGKHSIDKKTAIGHSSDEDMNLLKLLFEFKEECSDGGWHVESGEVVEEVGEENKG